MLLLYLRQESVALSAWIGYCFGRRHELCSLRDCLLVAFGFERAQRLVLLLLVCCCVSRIPLLSRNSIRLLLCSWLFDACQAFQFRGLCFVEMAACGSFCRLLLLDTSWNVVDSPKIPVRLPRSILDRFSTREVDDTNRRRFCRRRLLVDLLFRFGSP